MSRVIGMKVSTLNLGTLVSIFPLFPDSVDMTSLLAIADHALRIMGPAIHCVIQIQPYSIFSYKILYFFRLQTHTTNNRLTFLSLSISWYTVTQLTPVGIAGCRFQTVYGY